MYLIIVRREGMGQQRWQVYPTPEKEFLWTKEEMLKKKKQLVNSGEKFKIFKAEEIEKEVKNDRS